MVDLACPQDDTLQAYLAGGVDAASLDSMSTHLDGCPLCVQRLSQLEVKSSLPAGTTANERVRVEPAFTAAVNRLLKLSSIASLPLGPGSKLRDYYLLELLGEGGMGTVFKARHERLDKIVAVKVMRPGIGSDALVRFEREMKAVGRVKDANIVQATDAGDADGVPFLVMEYVDGVDLLKWVKTNGPMALYDAFDAIRQTARGLQHAHDRGLIHRDVKPSNLMRTPDGTVKILDLGLAVMAGTPERDEPRANDDIDPSELTSPSRMLGTRDYMAPEQRLNAHAVNARADVYALGGTLWFLLTGQPPHQGPRPPSVPEAVWNKLLAENPDERYSSVIDASNALPSLSPEQHFPGHKVNLAVAALVVALLIPLVIRYWPSGDLAKPPETALNSPLPKREPQREPTPGQLPMSRLEAVALQKAWAESLRLRVRDPEVNNGDFILIPPGEFDLAEQSRFVITRPYYLGMTEVTRSQFARFVQATGFRTDADVRQNAETVLWVINKDRMSGGTSTIKMPKANWQRPGHANPLDAEPVTQVSWNDAVAYCEWLSRTEGRKYRLPSYAELIWASRAGEASEVPPVEVTPIPRSTLQPMTVARGTLNAWGLHDTTCNVSEWCRDTFGLIPAGRHLDYFCEVPHASRLRRVAGDSYLPMAPSYNSPSGYIPEGGRSNIGFRIVREIDNK
ncbi:hypothetical protein BH11PLA2_BH11PLA2_25270 [soil metagenome]